MQEDLIMKCRMYAWLAWLTMAGLIVGAWAVMIFDPDDWWLSVLLGVTGLAFSAVAATLHIRSFAVRVCALVRAASYRPLPEGQGLRPVS